MSGFPSRIVKSTLGSVLRDPRTVEHPEYEFAARYMEIMKRQVVGVNLVSPRVSLVAVWGGASFTLRHQHEAWNVDESVAHPTLTRTSAGIYEYAFASSYQDMDGAAVPFTLVGGAFRIAACGSLPTTDALPYKAWVVADSEASVPTLVLTLTDDDDVAVDVPFWLEVL